MKTETPTKIVTAPVFLLNAPAGKPPVAFAEGERFRPLTEEYLNLDPNVIERYLGLDAEQ